MCYIELQETLSLWVVGLLSLFALIEHCGREGGLMVRALVPGVSGPALSSG